jgi:hypothetical protein
LKLASPENATLHHACCDGDLHTEFKTLVSSHEAWWLHSEIDLRAAQSRWPSWSACWTNVTTACYRTRTIITTTYLGRVGPHNVAIACLLVGMMGLTSAARVASLIRSTFTALRFGLMVGIAGGVPSKENGIRLGDMAVRQPTTTLGGVIHYDLGKTV